MVRVSNTFLIGGCFYVQIDETQHAVRSRNNEVHTALK